MLEVDGATRPLIGMPNCVARTLAVDSRGQVWIGGNNEIALLTPAAAWSQWLVCVRPDVYD